MENDNTLFGIFIFLVAVCIVVPVARRFKLGSVLGYLAAGMIIGPFGFGLIHNPEQVMHFAEYGVIMMLFLIGLELEPEMLWRLRGAIMGLGGMQVSVTTALFMAIGLSLGYSWQASLAVGAALSLSSTALVLQMLEEKQLLQTSAGESCFSVLLFQDLAVIPLLITMPLLAGDNAPVQAQDALSQLPGWLHVLCVAGAIIAIIIFARYLSHYVFYVIAKTNLREVFIATSLALVVGITLLMQLIGLSPALGAFIAGVVLANSPYRHTLETDIDPFKGLLLGLFFISIGMGIDFALFAQKTIYVLTLVVGLVFLKASLLWMMGRIFGLRKGQNTVFALSLAQGGEFAFVLFQYAGGFAILSTQQSSLFTLIVALSMATTPFLMMFNDYFVIPRYMSRLPDANYDAIDEAENPVILAGYGRFGQVIGRFLQAQGVKVTILEKDPDQIELTRKFGGSGYFGDASRLDLLKSAHADKAKLLVVAIDDADKCLEIVRLAREHFPNLKIFARARNRRHAYELFKLRVDYFRRETFDSSLTMAQQAMIFLGSKASDIVIKAEKFREHDEKSLRESFAFFEKEPELISFARQATGELERILQQDIRIPD